MTTAHTYTDPTSSDRINVCAAVLRQALAIVDPSAVRACALLRDATTIVDRFATGWESAETTIDDLTSLAYHKPVEGEDATAIAWHAIHACTWVLRGA